LLDVTPLGAYSQNKVCEILSTVRENISQAVSNTAMATTISRQSHIVDLQ